MSDLILYGFISWVVIGLFLSTFAAKVAEGTEIEVTQRDLAIWTFIWPFVAYVFFFRPKAGT